MRERSLGLAQRIVAALGLATLGMALCARYGADLTSTAPVHAHAPLSQCDPKVFLWHEPDPGKSQVAMIEDEPTGVLLQNREAGVDSEEWFFPTPFFVDSISSVNGFGKLYVFGTDREVEQATFLEKWEFEHPDREFLSRPKLKRTRVYSGADFLGSINAHIAVDPEERFVLVSHGTTQKFFDQLHLPTGLIVRVTSSLANPKHRVMFHGPAQHAVDGRVWIAALERTGGLLVLIDSGNDTVFESLTVMDQPTRVSRGYEFGGDPAAYQITDWFNGRP